MSVLQFFHGSAATTIYGCEENLKKVVVCLALACQKSKISRHYILNGYSSCYRFHYHRKPCVIQILS